MEKLVPDMTAARPDRHLQGIEGKLSAQCIRDLPAYDPPGKQISDERAISKTAGRIHVGDISDPPAGAVAVKSRSSRSDGRGCPAGAGTVVRGFFLLAAAPATPSSPISRSTVQRATCVPSRFSCRHTFRAP